MRERSKCCLKTAGRTDLAALIHKEEQKANKQQQKHWKRLNKKNLSCLNTFKEKNWKQKKPQKHINKKNPTKPSILSNVLFKLWQNKQWHNGCYPKMIVSAFQKSILQLILFFRLVTYDGCLCEVQYSGSCNSGCSAPHALYKWTLIRSQWPWQKLSPIPCLKIIANRQNISLVMSPLVFHFVRL